VIKVKGALRCAYCHGEAQGLLECCDGCGVLVHADCRRELGRCSTLGCQAPPAQRLRVHARESERGLLITGSMIRGWLKRLTPAFLVLSCLGCCLFTLDSITVRHPHSPHRWQMSRAMMIRVASANFAADHRRQPTDLAELLQDSPQGPYLEAHDGEFSDFRLVTHGRVVWIAVEVDLERNPYETETIRLLEVLYEHPPETNWAPLSSSALTSARPF
jgi:hypothetical protein